MTDYQEKAGLLLQKLASSSPEKILKTVSQEMGPENIALASSFSPEDQVLTHMIVKEKLDIGIFTLDTGRIPQESFNAMQETMRAYGIRYEVLVPDSQTLADFISLHGPNSFYESVENRKACCEIRKVKPLQKKLKTLKAWICGLRRSHGVTRSKVDIIEWDESNGLIKLNPLASWEEEDLWDYIRTNKVPYNKLNDQGYPSIGCSPCTRAVAEGEDIRAGRWWWEQPEHKECGLHRKK